MDNKDNSELPATVEAKFTMPPNKLKGKMGAGGLPLHLIEKGQSYIQDTDIDFLPYAKKHLEEIAKHLQALKESEEGSKEQKEHLQHMTQNIMQMKAHGGMFDYQIMSSISDVVLKFMDATRVINNDLYQIVDAHNNSINLVIASKLKKDGGDTGAMIVSEMREATSRHLKKYK